jgi:ketosteroid isomerase-like protein
MVAGKRDTARAMAEDPVQIVRRAYEGFARALELYSAGRLDEWNRMPEWDELYAPEVVLEELPEMPDTDVYHGVEGIKRWFEVGLAAFADVRWVPREYTVHGASVVVDVLGTFRGGGSGAEVTMSITHVFTLRGGRITRIRGFLKGDDALAAIAGEASGTA